MQFFSPNAAASEADADDDDNDGKTTMEDSRAHNAVACIFTQ